MIIRIPSWYSEYDKITVSSKYFYVIIFNCNMSTDLNDLIKSPTEIISLPNKRCAYIIDENKINTICRIK